MKKRNKIKGNNIFNISFLTSSILLSISGFYSTNSLANSTSSTETLSKLETYNNFLSGLALHENATAIGDGSISTGNGTVSIGKNAFSSGNNMTKEEYEKLIKANKEKIKEINGKELRVKEIEVDLNRLNETNKEVLKKVNLAKSLESELEEKRNNFNTNKDVYLREIETKKGEKISYRRQIEDLEKRLNLINKIDSNFINADNIDNAVHEEAVKLKAKMEDGLTFIKDYNENGIPIDKYEKFIKNYITLNASNYKLDSVLIDNDKKYFNIENLGKTVHKSLSRTKDVMSTEIKDFNLPVSDFRYFTGAERLGEHNLIFNIFNKTFNGINNSLNNKLNTKGLFIDLDTKERFYFNKTFNIKSKEINGVKIDFNELIDFENSTNDEINFNYSYLNNLRKEDIKKIFNIDGASTNINVYDYANELKTMIKEKIEKGEIEIEEKTNKTKITEDNVFKEFNINKIQWMNNHMVNNNLKDIENNFLNNELNRTNDESSYAYRNKYVLDKYIKPIIKKVNEYGDFLENNTEDNNINNFKKTQYINEIKNLIKILKDNEEDIKEHLDMKIEHMISLFNNGKNIYTWDSNKKLEDIIIAGKSLSINGFYFANEEFFNYLKKVALRKDVDWEGVLDEENPKYDNYIKAGEILKQYTDEIKRLRALEKNTSDEILEKETLIKNKEKEINDLMDLLNNLNSETADAETIKEEINNKNEEIKALKDGIENIRNGMNVVSDGEGSIAHGNNTVAIGKNSIAIGAESMALSENSIAIGKGTIVLGENSIAIGPNHKIVGNKSSTLGDPNVIYGNNNHVIGNDNLVGLENAPKNNNFILGSNINATTVEDSITLGNNSTAKSNSLSIGSEGNERKLVFLADGEISENSKEAINGSQLYKLTEKIKNLNTGNTNVTITGNGGDLNFSGSDDIAINVNEGNVNIDLSNENKEILNKAKEGIKITSTTKDGEKKEKDLHLGGNLNFLSNDNIKTNLNEKGEISFELGENITTSSISTKDGIRIDENGMNLNDKKIANVKDGEISENSKDVVNGRQLYNTHLMIMDNAKQINGLNDKIKNVEERSKNGVAIAGAVAMLPQPTLPGKSMVSASTTNYRGKQALAVGYSKLSENGKHIIKFSGSTNMSNKKDMLMGASYGYQW